MKKNKINADFRRVHDFKARETRPLYQCADGTKSTDVTKAKLNVMGQPIVLGYSDTEFVSKPIVSGKPLTFNPHDVNARLLAIEARAKLNELASVPNDYSDKFEAIKYANNVASAFENKVSESK